MDYEQTLDELNITLGDTENVTFTQEEKARALQKAWNDNYVVKVIWDSSLTFTAGTYRYALPNTLTTIKDIYLSPSNSTVTDFPQKVSQELYEVVDGYIQFKNFANSTIPTGYVLYLKGNYKLDYGTDTLPTTTLQEYVIALAGWNTLTLLGFKKANLFLKNDTSMSELIALRRELKQDVLEARGKLVREFESV